MFGTTWRRDFRKLGKSNVFSTLHQAIREEHWFVECHELKCVSCPDHILGCWKTATPAMTSIIHLDWVWPVKSRRSGRVHSIPEWILLVEIEISNGLWSVNVGIMLHQLHIIPVHLLASKRYYELFTLQANLLKRLKEQCNQITFDLFF